MAKVIIFVLCFFASNAFASFYVGAGVGQNHQTIPGGETGNPGDIWYTQATPATQDFFIGVTQGHFGLEAGYMDLGAWSRTNVSSIGRCHQRISTQLKYARANLYFHLSDNLRIFGSYGIAKYKFQNREVASYNNAALYQYVDNPKESAAQGFTVHANAGDGLAPIFGYGLNYQLNRHVEIRASAQYLKHIDVSPWTVYSNLSIYSVDLILTTR